MKAVEESRRPTVVTRNGKPVALLSPICYSEEEFEAWALAHVFAEDQQAALNEYARGETRAAEDVFCRTGS